MDTKPDKRSGLGAYDLLLTAIEDGDLVPGSRLREHDLAEQFGLSRTPIREALKRLEAQGLITHQPHHGATVAQLDYAGLTELYFLRELLEAAAARLAAIHCTPAEIHVLKELVEHDRAFQGDGMQMARRNRLFHRQIHLAARNRFLLTTLDNMRTSLMLLAGTTLASGDRWLRSIEEHSQIVDAIGRHDPEAAEAETRQHINNAFKVRMQLRLQGERLASG
jgi:DNA-binding GntR family transcriptional regulator